MTTPGGPGAKRRRPSGGRTAARLPAPPTKVAPTTPWSTGFVLDGCAWWTWWGQDAEGTDCFAARDGHLLAARSVADLEALAVQLGWPVPEDTEPEVLDLTKAQTWLRGRRLSLDPVSALNLWNIATDVAASTGQRFAERGNRAQTCHTMLTTANVPYVFGFSGDHRPRWSARQIDTLRAVLGDAVHAVRTGLPQGTP